VIFLAEAFTRPKPMYRLAKLGFSQSYTYFTWRSTKHEITEYIGELTRPPVADFLRPSFWPNTPDILPEYLQVGGRPAFIVRLALAATLSSSYGIYGPAFELLVSAALPGREEYLDSEKYEFKSWPRPAGGGIRDLVARINRIRRENPALQSFRNVVFYPTDNEHLLFYERATEDFSNVLFVAVNLDPFHLQDGRVRIDLKRLGIRPGEPFLVQDLLGGERYIWQGESGYLALDPGLIPVHILRVHRHLRHEQDFDYFM
jgi:starch synthase (maltosyl-transferring)